jgi:hypothetical protein
MSISVELPSTARELDAQARVWIYQSSRPLTDQESREMSAQLQQFATQWTAHNKQLKAAGFVLFNAVLVLMVDETKTAASGCSIDTSVHFIQQLEKTYNIQLFDRLLVYYKSTDNWQQTTLTHLAELVQSGQISTDVPVINALVDHKASLEQELIATPATCWMSAFVR